MSGLTIGINVDDLRLDPQTGLRKASLLGFRAAEIGAVAGDLDARTLSGSGRRHLARFADGLGLRLEALTADVAGLRLTDTAAVQERVERTCGVLDMARDVGVGVVSAAAGALTHPETQEPSPVAIEALQRIGEFADSRGVTFALRPSYDSAERMAAVLDALCCPAIKIGLDPAALVMTGANPMSFVERYANQIALLHARDGSVGLADRPGQETALGDGDVDFLGILAVLSATDYTGACIARRTDSQRPDADLAAAREALSKMLPA